MVELEKRTFKFNYQENLTCYQLEFVGIGIITNNLAE